MSIHDLIPVITALAPYSWPVTIGILALLFRSRIKEVSEAKFGDKLYLKWGEFPPDGKFAQAIGEKSPVPAAKQLSAPSGVKWGNVGNLFWLGNDLVWTAQTTLRGAPKETILQGLTQAYHHISELGLADSAPAKQLSLLKSETASLPEATLDRVWRSGFAEKTYAITRMINDLLGEQQPTFRANPQS